MLCKTKAIVLHTIKQGESGRIAKLYTEEFGMRSVFIRSTQSKKRGSSAALYQALTILEMDLDIREERSLQTVVSAQLVAQKREFSMDPFRSSVAMFIAELFYRTLQEEETSNSLYSMLAGYISRLSMEKNITSLPLEFTLDLALHYGIYPDMEADGDVLDIREGRLTSVRPHHKELIEGEALVLLKGYHGMGFVAEADSTKREVRRELLDGMLLYFKIHIPHFSELRSYTVFKEVFSV